MGRIANALKALGNKITHKAISGKTTAAILQDISDNYTVALVSPDKSVWDLKIANDGTISATKRT